MALNVKLVFVPVTILHRMRVSNMPPCIGNVLIHLIIKYTISIIIHGRRKKNGSVALRAQVCYFITNIWAACSYADVEFR